MLISEIKRRTFCKLLGVLGLSGMGCNIDYSLGHLKGENEAGEPLPKCIQNPQFEPAFDDPIWREGNVKLDDFIQSIPDNDFVFSKYENDELVILIQNVPIDADIFNARHVASSGNNVFSEEQIANYYDLDSDDPKVLISVEMKLPLQIKDGEYYVKSFVDTGGNFYTIPQRNSSECSGDYIAWLEPKLYESVSNMIDEVIEEKKKKKKKKSSGKKDACYHKVRSRYDVWPSAYASGALVKCRKVGAKNWGNKEEFIPGGESSKYGDVTVEEMISKIAQEHGVPVEKIQDEFKMGVEEEMEHAEEEMIAQEITLDHLVEDPEYYSKLDKLQLEEIYIVEEKSELTPENLEKILRDEGGASGMDPFKKAIDASEEEIKKALDKMSNVGMHEDGDYILEDDKEIIIKEEGVIDEEQEETTLDEKRKKRKKAGTESGSNARVQKALKEAGLIATLPTEKEDTSPAVEEAEKKEKDTQPVAPHLRLVKSVEEANHGERRDQNEESQEEMKTFSERWLEKKQKRQSSVRQSQKDLGFTLLMTCLLGIMFIAMVLADIFLS
jgi:hypothetical protein